MAREADSIVFPYPVLLCDLGGTNCRFALVTGSDADIAHLEPLATADFADFASAIRAAISRCGCTPASVIVCAAGPVQGRSVALTNAAWSFDGAQLARELDLRQGLLLNDFEAQALSLPVLKADWIRTIGPVAKGAAGTRIILGPGTGLGMAALVETQGRYLALSSEAGHMGFAASGGEDWEVWQKLHRVHARITPETLLSGSGLVRLHDARKAVADGEEFKERDHKERDNGDAGAGAITRAALADTHSEEAATVRHFWRLTARLSGDLALACLARGGVTLAGGILPRIAPLLDEQTFRDAFEDKAPMRPIVNAISVHLLTNPAAVLHGMAAIAAQPDLYALDYRARCWCPVKPEP